MYVIADPAMLRKAASFVEKIDRLEDDFGFQLEVPAEGLPFALRGERPDPNAVFVVARMPDNGTHSGPLALGMKDREG